MQRHSEQTALSFYNLNLVFVLLFNFSEFDFKIIDSEKIILSINDKKMILNFNEVFSIHSNEYIIFRDNSEIHLLNYAPNQEKKFSYLSCENFKYFLSSFTRNIQFLKIKLYKNNIKYINKLFLLLFILLFILQDKDISKEKMNDKINYSTKENLYRLLNSADIKSQQEVKTETIQEKKVQKNEDNYEHYIKKYHEKRSEPPTHRNQSLI